MQNQPLDISSPPDYDHLKPLLFKAALQNVYQKQGKQGLFVIRSGQAGILTNPATDCINSIPNNHFYATDGEPGEMKTELNLSIAAKGMYILKIQSNDKSVYRKVTITE